MKRSIKTQTLIYFMMLAAVVIGLFWTTQEWLFSSQFITLKREEVIRSFERYSNNFNYQNDNYDALIDNLDGISRANNMLIYAFAFKGEIKENGTENHKYFDGDFKMEAVISPHIGAENRFVPIPFDTFSQNDFINLVGAADEGEASNTAHILEENKIRYGSFFRYSDGYTFYFYMEASPSRDDISAGIYRIALLSVSAAVIFLTFLFSLLLSKLMTRPISKLVGQTANMAKGNYSDPITGGKIHEINELADGLNIVASEFNKTEQLRRDFLANITHDLRTPLTLIRGYAELICDSLDKAGEKNRENSKVGDIDINEVSREFNRAAKEKKHALTIIEESIRLANLVDDIQLLSKIQAGTDAINPEYFDMDKFLQPLVNQFGVVNIKYGCPIEYINNADSNSLTVFADRDKIAQVMYNLITNAINYADKERPQVFVRLYREVELVKSGKKGRKNSKGRNSEEYSRRHYVKVEVIDNGKGIAPEDIASVWDRYYRANQQKRKSVGSGLGLSIVKSIFKIHNANYGIESELNKGTKFWFKLQIVEKDKE